MKKRIHGEAGLIDVPDDAQNEPPVPCDLAVGDVVTYTNDYGVSFKGKIITGFSPVVESWKGCVYLAKEAWWFPVPIESLKKEKVT